MHAVAGWLFTSTAIAAGITLLAAALRSRIPAATRHVFWIIAAAQFALPVAWITNAGIRLAAVLGLAHAAPAPGIDITRVMISTHALPAQPVAASGTWEAVAIAGWLCGTAVLVAVWLRRWFTAARAAAGPAGRSEQEVFERAKLRMGISGAVELRLSAAEEQPSARGWRKPVVVIPAGLSAKLRVAELESILVHELAHLRRRDNLSACLLHAFTCALWFHPLLWWIEEQAAADRERACDELVLARGARASDYIQGICRAVRFCAQGAVAGVSPATGIDLKQRMELIMSYSDRKHTSGWRVAPALLAVVLVAVPFSTGLLRAGPQTLEKRTGVEFVSAKVLAGGAPRDHAKTLGALAALFNPFNTPQPPGLNEQWSKWLNEDVAYIIRPEERAAFLRLGSDEERQHFVDQFWAQRAEAAGVDEQALRSEHARRMAYANEHFHGIASDRARLYFVMGPPDEIESHPDQHYEQWLYHSLDKTPDSLLVTFNI